MAQSGWSPYWNRAGTGAETQAMTRYTQGKLELGRTHGKTNQTAKSVLDSGLILRRTLRLTLRLGTTERPPATDGRYLQAPGTALNRHTRGLRCEHLSLRQKKGNRLADTGDPNGTKDLVRPGTKAPNTTRRARKQRKQKQTLLRLRAAGLPQTAEHQRILKNLPFSDHSLRAFSGT